MTDKMPREIWLLTNKSYEDDDEFKQIWSPDADAAEIYEGYEVDAKYHHDDVVKAKDKRIAELEGALKDMHPARIYGNPWDIAKAALEKKEGE